MGVDGLVGLLNILSTTHADADGKGGKWERPLNCDSIPRCWHSATFLPGKNLLVAFGKRNFGGGLGLCLCWVRVMLVYGYTAPVLTSTPEQNPKNCNRWGADGGGGHPGGAG